MNTRKIAAQPNSTNDPQGYPAVITPADTGSDLVGWAEVNSVAIRERLTAHGAILFRGFTTDLIDFRSFAAATSHRLEEFADESSPRSRISGPVYTSTDYPNRYPIQMHSEYSYGARWPMLIYFCCLTPSRSGGATPIADTRRVLERLSLDTVARFRKGRVLYRRNYSPQSSVSWQRAFSTDSREDVERYCLENEISCRWLAGDRLQTRHATDAILSHPLTGDEVWFNHAFFFNVRSLEPESLRRILLQEADDDLQTNTYFADGTHIDAETIEEIRCAYNESCVDVRWERGDVLILDNMLTAHGRRPYEGLRNVVVSMGNGESRANVQPLSRSRTPHVSAGVPVIQTLGAS